MEPVGPMNKPNRLAIRRLYREVRAGGTTRFDARSFVVDICKAADKGNESALRVIYAYRMENS